MKKATRELLKIKNLTKEDVVKVNLTPGKDYKEKKCHANARNERLKNGGWSVAGWLVTPYFPEHGTHIIPHWWNVDKENNHYDITPFSPRIPGLIENSEYVVDAGVSDYFNNSKDCNGKYHMPDSFEIKV